MLYKVFSSGFPVSKKDSPIRQVLCAFCEYKLLQHLPYRQIGQ